VCGFKFNAQENLLECELCRSYLVGRQQIPNKLVQGINRGELGYFKAEQALKNLKPTVKGHLSSAAHKLAADAAAAEAEAAKAQRNVGLNVARIAYKTIREGDSHVRFEREVSAINLMGLNLGEKNQHRSFVSSFAESAEAVLRSSQRRFLDTPRVETGRRPVFAVNADKLTCMRRTSQLVGIIMIVDGEFIAGMLGCTTCGTNLDGDHTAASLLSVLEDKDFVGLSRERLRKQCVGAAFDGAYFSTHVPSWFCRKLCISEVFLSAIHDPAHRIELAIGDIRNCNDTALQWYKEIAEKLSSLQQEYRYGKHYEEAILAAINMQTELRAPTYVATSRFAESERKVYVNFHANWSIFHSNKTGR